MITSFKCKRTEKLFNGGYVKEFESFRKRAIQKLIYLKVAIRLKNLDVPPGNRLEKLSGDRVGQHSIRINDQWRICFEWTDDGVANVEIVDYH